MGEGLIKVHGGMGSEKRNTVHQENKKEPTQGSTYITCPNSDLGSDAELQVGS